MTAFNKDVALVTDGTIIQVWCCATVEGVVEMQGEPAEGQLVAFDLDEAVPGMLWDGEALSVPPVEPAPTIVPEQIAMHKAKKALVINGWMDAVQAAIDGIENPLSRACTRIEFDTAPNLVRQGATTLAVMAAIGMSEAQRDEMILLATTLP